MGTVDCSSEQLKEAGQLDALPPLPPRPPYVNLHIRKGGVKCAKSDRQSGPSLQNVHQLERRNGRLLYEAVVQFTYKEHVNKDGFLRIYCYGSEEFLARLEVFDCKETASKDEQPLYLKPFTGVNSVEQMEFQEKQCIVINLLDENKFVFSATDNKPLLEYCKLLYEIPELVVPVRPKYHLVSQQHVKESNRHKLDATRHYVVFLMKEGIGPKLNLEGLHIVTIESTISIYNFYNGKHLLAWEHCNIRRADCIFTLVYLVIDKGCQEGSGVLWMYCPDHLVAEFTESLKKFIHRHDQQHNFVLDQAPSLDSPDDQKNSICPRRSAMSSAQAKKYNTMISLQSQNSNQSTNLPKEGACNHSEKTTTLHPPEVVKLVTTPIPVSSYTEQSSMMPSSVPTEEPIACTSRAGSYQPPLQDESSNVVVNSDGRFHPSVNSIHTAIH